MNKTGFYGRGEKKHIKKVMKSSEARALLHECGDMLPIPGHISNNLKASVIKYVCGSSKVLVCAETRGTQWEKLEKKRTQRLMPDEDTLNLSCLCANHLAHWQKTFSSAAIPLQLEMVGESLMENVSQ